MKKPFFFGRVALALALLLGGSGSSWAGDFYEGKTIRFIVGFSAGGGVEEIYSTPEEIKKRLEFLAPKTKK